MKKYNLSQIMSAAWRFFRKGVQSLAKDIKRKYGIDTYFLFENIFTGSENADKDISFYGMIQDYLDKQKKQKKKMKKLFAELTVSED